MCRSNVLTALTDNAYKNDIFYRFSRTDILSNVESDNHEILYKWVISNYSMETQELRDVGFTLLGGAFTSILIFVLIQRFPTVDLASDYINFQISLLFLLGSLTPAVAVYARTPQLRLISMFIFASILTGVSLLFYSIGGELSLVLYALPGIGFALLSVYAVHNGDISKEMLYHGVGGLSSGLFVFGLLYNGVAIVYEGNAEFILPLLVLLVVFGSVIKGLRVELA